MARAIEILVVEDEVAAKRLVDVVFRTASDDFLVQRVGSLEGAIKAVRTLTPDLILLDLDLPDAKGLEAVKVLLDLAPRSAIVILTASTDNAIVEPRAIGRRDEALAWHHYLLESDSWRACQAMSLASCRIK